MKIILWYRNDLRTHDHEALWEAAQQTAQVVPVYVFDPRPLAGHPLGFAKTGAVRQQFLAESVLDLRQRLRQLGSDLVVRVGRPEEVLPALAAELGATAVYASEEVTQEEQAVETALEERLEAAGRTLQLFWQATLHHLDDLPMPVRNLPAVFTQFKNKIEKFGKVRPLFAEPANLVFTETLELGTVPAGPATTDYQVAFRGGETEGLRRLHDYFWTHDLLRTYKETRNGMLGLDYSSKFSAWLALGCLSPRFVWAEIKRYETERVQNESTYWLGFELLWRDYFRFVAVRFGNHIFRSHGLKDEPLRHAPATTKSARHTFGQWQLGETGVPLIDANMKELLATGYMSNRGRQNAASFLVKDLQLDWRWGAAWFESQLIDYDVCSNWGNWLYVAGVGNDPRESRYFNILRQATYYDAAGEYVRHWLPQLTGVPADKIHVVGLLTNDEQKRFDVRLGVDYPNPLVDVRKWSQEDDDR